MYLGLFPPRYRSEASIPPFQGISSSAVEHTGIPLYPRRIVAARSGTGDVDTPRAYRKYIQQINAARTQIISRTGTVHVVANRQSRLYRCVLSSKSPARRPSSTDGSSAGTATATGALFAVLVSCDRRQSLQHLWRHTHGIGRTAT